MMLSAQSDLSIEEKNGMHLFKKPARKEVTGESLAERIPKVAIAH